MKRAGVRDDDIHVEKVSVRKIAALLKVSPGTVYNHTVGPTRTRTKPK